MQEECVLPKLHKCVSQCYFMRSSSTTEPGCTAQRISVFIADPGLLMQYTTVGMCRRHFEKMEIQNKSNFGIKTSDSGSQRQRLLLVGSIVCTWIVSNMWVM